MHKCCNVKLHVIIYSGRKSNENKCDCILENRPSSVVTNTEIHFLLVDESHTHALSRDTKHLSLDGQVCFCRRLFSDDAKPRGCISWPVWPLRGINKTAWGAKLILTADLVYQVSCPGELCLAGSPTDGTTLPFVSECLL